MFGAIKRLGKNSKKLNRKRVYIKIIRNKEVQEFILDLNRIDQLLLKGEDSLEDIIGEYSSDQGFVVFKGKSKNKKKGSPISLLDTGDFYKSFKVRISGDDIKIIADDEKEGGDLLTERFGKHILGLSTKNKNELAKKILPFIITETRRVLFS